MKAKDLRRRDLLQAGLKGLLTKVAVLQYSNDLSTVFVSGRCPPPAERKEPFPWRPPPPACPSFRTTGR